MGGSPASSGHSGGWFPASPFGQRTRGSKAPQSCRCWAESRTPRSLLLSSTLVFTSPSSPCSTGTCSPRERRFWARSQTRIKKLRKQDIDRGGIKFNLSAFLHHYCYYCSFFTKRSIVCLWKTCCCWGFGE